MNRRMQFLTGEMYHLYNRGNRKAEVFHERKDFLYFLRQLREYLQEYPVTLIACCLMPNHYHLLTRQDADNAIPEMMQAFGTSLSKTYNKNMKPSVRYFKANSATSMWGTWGICDISRGIFIATRCR